MGILRIILAISVVISHSSSIFGFSLVGGQVAVQSFYIISGFYMTLILKEKYIGVNNSYKLFITNRLLKLYPIYWTVLILTVLAAIGVFIYTKGYNIGRLQPYWDYYKYMDLSSLLFLLFTNVFLLFQDIVMFLGIDKSSGSLFFTSDFWKTDPMLHSFLLVPQAWTIGVEITFYIIAPFLVKRKLSFIAILIFLSIMLRLILIQNGLKEDPWTNRFFPTELVFFLLGTVGYHIYRKLQTIKINLMLLRLIFSFILSFTVFYSFLSLPGKIYIYEFLFFLCMPFVFILSNKWKLDRYIGELSYSIYISHMFIWIVIGLFDIPLFGGSGLNLTIITILFSILLNEFIGKRIEHIRQLRLVKTSQ